MQVMSLSIAGITNLFRMLLVKGGFVFSFNFYRKNKFCFVCLFVFKIDALDLYSYISIHLDPYMFEFVYLHVCSVKIITFTCF